MSKSQHNHTAQAILGLATTWCLTHTAHAANFAATSAMAVARYNHAANLLINNKVLVSGGQDGTATLLNAEVYDATAGTWATTGAMKSRRELHNGVQLSNGKILVPSGWDGTTVVTAADLYDPVAGTFATTAALGTARSYYGLVVLTNGKALISGGQDVDWADLASAELYDATAATWTATGNMRTGRYEHVLVRLPTGKVLAVGGGDTSAEIYDSATAAWSVTGSMSVARRGHTALLLNTGKVLVVGGNNGAATLASAEVYDPASGTFSATGNMPVAREMHSMSLLPDGKVLVSGGGNAGGAYFATASLYDPSAATWSATSNMTAARQNHTATVLNTGKVLIAGGENASGALSTAEIYTPDAAATTCTLTSASNPSAVGQSVAFTTAVTAANAVPTGTVTFKIDGATAGVASLGSGRAMYATATLTVGTHTVDAVYAGNTNFATCTTPQLTQNLLAFTLDFAVTNIALTPAAPVVSSTFSTAITLKNNGVASGNAGNLNLWLNQPTAMACNAAGNFSKPAGTLAAGASTTVTFTNLAAGTAGGKVLRAFVDSACAVNENNESNNQVSKSYRVPTAPVGQADLVITNVITNPAVPLPNSTFAAVVVVKNQGTALTNGGQLSLWANQATAQACNAAGNKTATVTALDAGASSVVTITGLAAGGSGVKTLRAFVDSACSVAESDETNNQFTQNYAVTARPDFVVTNAVLTPATPAPNTTFTAAVTVKNQGTAAGAAGFVDVWINQPNVQECGAEGEQFADAGMLLPGASRTVMFTNLPAGAAGTKTLRAFVDSWCTTAEAVEGNNQFTKLYSSDAADFVVTAVTLTPASPAINGTFDAAITVKNQGTAASDGGQLSVWANQATAQACGATADKSVAVGSVAAGATKSLTVTGLSAGAVAGSRTVRAFVDGTCTVVEMEEGNNQLVQAYTVTSSITHHDGYGHTWTDGVPLGTYNVNQALRACQAYASGSCHTNCGCSSNGSNCTSNGSKVWFYTGGYIGTTTANSCESGGNHWD